MSSSYGEKLKITIFGQSHSASIGVIIEGIPSGVKIDTEALLAFMSRRAPGKNPLSTKRHEADIPNFTAGLVDGITCGTPICAIINNTDTKSGDYENIRDIPRPSHADYSAFLKFGKSHDIRGGGHFSGRLTAPLCIAGAIAIQILKEKNIFIGAHISSIKNISDSRFDKVKTDKSLLQKLTAKDFSVLDDKIADKMKTVITNASSDGDSVGGTIECAVVGLAGGIGQGIFGGLENRISQAIFGIPAIKGIEFGNGFEAAELFGSENNDEYIIDQDNNIVTKTNNHGGILGGLSSGMPLVFRVAVKPTPSISKVQNSVRLSDMTETKLEIKGRHDPCIVPRAVPCVEAAAALAILDAIYCN